MTWGLSSLRCGRAGALAGEPMKGFIGLLELYDRRPFVRCWAASILRAVTRQATTANAR
jgi:hypothetical protein